MPHYLEALEYSGPLLSGAVLFIWLYNSTSGSILAVKLWHGSFDASVAGAQPEISAIVTAVVLFVVILIGRRYGPENLPEKPRQMIYK